MCFHLWLVFVQSRFRLKLQSRKVYHMRATLKSAVGAVGVLMSPSVLTAAPVPSDCFARVTSSCCSDIHFDLVWPCAYCPEQCCVQYFFSSSLYYKLETAHPGHTDRSFDISYNSPQCGFYWAACDYSEPTPKCWYDINHPDYIGCVDWGPPIGPNDCS